MNKYNGCYKARLVLGLLLTLSMVGFSIAEQTLPKHYPDNFHAEGFISSVVLAKQQIILDGIIYSTNISTTAYDKNGSKISLLRLSTGTKVGVEFIRHDKKRWEINKVWILPSNYDVESHAG